MAAAAELVPAIIANARDRGSLSDELHFAATDPAERYHLDHGRANVLRALDIAPSDTVLEIGAEYGALTRYLGERAARVHAVEPDPAAAEVAATRTADLDGVRVGRELPAGDHDLAVVAHRYATPGLLRALRSAGAVAVRVDDRTGRREVEAALAAAGWPAPTVLACAPDHRITRAVLSEELIESWPRLAAALDPAGRHGHLLLAGDVRWPATRLACYFNTADRAAVFCTRADVVRTATGAQVRHAPLRPDPAPAGGICVRSFTDPVHDAPTMLAVLLEQPWRVTELLAGWRELVRAEAAHPGLWDLVPHNVLVDGPALRPIDLEWTHAHAGVREVTERGLLVLAHHLTEAGWAGAAPGGTMRELAGWLGVLLGLDPSYVDAAVDREVRFGVLGSCGGERGTTEIRARVRAVWERRLEQRATGYRSLGIGHAERNWDEVRHT
ncbi:MAG TPA: rRNA adenine N-6-methyltransferase family protein [Actinophytocola sp.]|uniref:rRNA adenine N-6-methyltransferase family protein n=1 Tax=Actinophytocola sp. TaxID=1872138 RepID=UPI002DDD0415|nr:rRNA adenine N-6-methyltransferase family protein [Actinophytocola sp.]HEV2780592.1 rRNA adenine N-6-methyltransferase family protein [Actinophytocola sp.]